MKKSEILRLSMLDQSPVRKDGTAFSFAHFINPVGEPHMAKAYYEHFSPSENLQEPRANVGVFVMCAETKEKAREIQETMDLMMLRIEKGISAALRRCGRLRIHRVGAGKAFNH